MQTLKYQAKVTQDWDAELEPHLLPAPPTAAELAAMEAALEAKARRRATRSRILVGVAAAAVAITTPDLSLGAMGAPLMRVSMDRSVTELPATLWSPSAGAPAPVYAPVMAAEEIAPAAVTFSSRANFGEFESEVPLDFLVTGSERFDLAFAGVEMPSVQSVSISARVRRDALTAPRKADAVRAPLADLVEVQQLTVSRGFRATPAPGLRSPVASLAPVSADVSPVEQRSIAVANESVEAAFAGMIDVSAAARRAVPTAPSRQQRLPDPQRDSVADPVARVVPIPSPDAALSASAAAQAELVVKSKLDARVNGVLTGAVDFRQLDGTIAIRLGSVVDMLRDRFSASEIEHLRAGQSINAFVPLAELQAAGIPISYNPAYDEVEFGIDYNDAPNAGKVQIDQIGAPTIGTDRVGMDQIIPR